MAEIYRVPPWLMMEHWEMHYHPKNKPDYFFVYIFDATGGFYEGKGVSIAHAAKNAYKQRKQNVDHSISSKGQALSSSGKT